MIQTGDKRMAAGAGEAAESGFQAKDPAQRRGDADRAVGVAAEAEMDQPGGHRCGRTAGGSAGDPRQIVRVARRAIVAVFGGEAIGVGIHLSIPLSRAPALCSWRTAQLSLAAGGRPLSSSAPARVVCPATSNRFFTA